MATDSVARGLAIIGLSNGGGGSIDAYLKSATVQDNTLIITDKNNNQITFTDNNTEYSAGEGIKIENGVISINIPNANGESF